jgi:3-methyl-2-oxobutanoate hydroxymethyltransferase
MLGIYTKFHPRFVRHYAELGRDMLAAFQHYVSDVRSREFPSADESY